MEAIEFFKVEKNGLTNSQMVFSDCEQLGHLCYAFDRKPDAEQCARELNEVCNKEYQAKKDTMVLTWRHKPTV